MSTHAIPVRIALMNDGPTLVRKAQRVALAICPLVYHSVSDGFAQALDFWARLTEKKQMRGHDSQVSALKRSSRGHSHSPMNWREIGLRSDSASLRRSMYGRRRTWPAHDVQCTGWTLIGSSLPHAQLHTVSHARVALGSPLVLPTCAPPSACNLLPSTLS